VATWDRPRVLSVSPLARQLIGYLADGLPDEARARGESVLFDVLRPAAKATIELPMPADDRARDIAVMLLRLFLAETGLTFSQWRVHARLQAGISSLAEGRPVASVAGHVGYATPSAFVAAFRRVTGHTPAAYFALAQAPDGA
jgi:transcriptional regulator GlxA family with amidase domain